MTSPSILALLLTVGPAGGGQEPPEGQPVFPATTELVTFVVVFDDLHPGVAEAMRARDGGRDGGSR